MTYNSAWPLDYTQKNCDELLAFATKLENAGNSNADKLRQLLRDGLIQEALNQGSLVHAIGHNLYDIAHVAHDTNHCSWITDTDIETIDKAWDTMQKKLKR